MVIGNDEIESQPGSGLCGSKIADSGVDTDHQANALPGDGLQYRRLHAVAISQAVRHMEIHLAAEHLESGLKQDDGRGAIHVIVAVDEDGFLARNGSLHTRDGCGHTLHGVGIEQVFDAGMKENIGFGSAAYPALRQQLGYDER